MILLSDKQLFMENLQDGPDPCQEGADIEEFIQSPIGIKVKRIAKAQAEVSLKEALDKAESFIDDVLDCHIPCPTQERPIDIAEMVRGNWQQLREEIGC